MEHRTIGKFMTALRKANGMTQKDLAEKLNVSDKTVSRWERDEGAPDLSLIPVIAEIFGVTCDELLRGERKPEAQRISEEPTPKGEKQRQRILTLSLSRYRTQSFISIGISAVGLIAAMIGNLGFNRGYIGFFVGAIFYVASLVCQAIFVDGAFLSISDEELAGAEIERFKASVLDLTRRSVYITLTVFGATLPLIIFPGDTYLGLEIRSWLLSGAILAALMRVLCSVIWYFVYAGLLKKGFCILSQREEHIFWQKHTLKRRCAVVLGVVLVITFAAQLVVNEVWGAWNLAKGTEFYDYESFAAFMEQDVPYEYESESGGYVAAEPLDTIYYDEYGNEITGEEAFREELVISDGTPEGKVVCTFVRRNHMVVSWSAADTEDGLPITVKTQADYDAAEVKVDLINISFAALYILESIVTMAIYLKKRRSLC